MFAKPDLYIFHAPSVYDFRKYRNFRGPIADVIPATGVFEMYPVGITSIASYLEDRGFRTQIVNLARNMLADPDYDVERAISKSRARFFALDLHWLPHAHGSIEIARLLKKYHPNSPVIMGGMSASYFHRELLGYSCVDYVLRGDSVEEPFYRLLQALAKGLILKDVPNLTFREESGRVVENPLSYVPSSLDDVDVPAYHYLLATALKRGDFKSSLPYQDWLKYPITMLLTSRGCSMNCAICGGSSSSYKVICGRGRPAFRSPARLREDVRTISLFSRAPIFVIHDLRQGGFQYAKEVLEGLAVENVSNEFIFELFRPAPASYFKMLQSSVNKYSLQISIESQAQRIRKTGGKFYRSTNKEIIETMRNAFRHGCRKIDLFFLTGLPGQSYSDALGCVDFSRHLITKLRDEFGPAAEVVPYVAPYAPFLDPGSPIHQHPDKYGFRILWNNLEDFRTALLAPSWKYMINYETKWMNRHQLVQATYAASRGLNALKGEMGLVDDHTFLTVKTALEKSQRLMELIDRLTKEELGYLPRGLFPLPTAERVLLKVHTSAGLDEIGSALCGSNEMHWPLKARFSGPFSLLKLGCQLLFGAARAGKRGAAGQHLQKSILPQQVGNGSC